MSGSTISTAILTTVKLGGGGYVSPLIITSAGVVAPTLGGANGVLVASTVGRSLVNYGLVGAGVGTTGGAGTAGSNTGGALGTGVSATKGGNGGNGGMAVDMVGLGTVTNYATVAAAPGGAGGNGGNGASGAGIGALAGFGGTGGAGGDGVDLAAGGWLSNLAAISGGAGGAGGRGGISGAGYINGLGGAGGTGGNGADVVGGYLLNSGIISGGPGGTGGTYAISGVGGAGVYLDGGTVINAGTIAGGAGSRNGDAVQFGTAASLLVIDPGAVFAGNVVADAAVADVLELSGTSTGGLAGVGTQFLDFQDISFASGAGWSISGDSVGLASGVTIAGFTMADRIDLTDFAATASSYVAGSGLVLSNATASETIGLVGNFSAGNFSIASDGAVGTVITEVTCYAKGTRIATAQGEVPVEALRIGMEVKTMHSGLQKIKWIGHRSYAAPFANHAKVLPVCIAAGAIARGMPGRDLYVSPGHAICVDGVFIHAARLVNGVSITQAKAVDAITYFHVETENHEVIFAEGCPAETFMGEYFRKQFHNAAEFGELYPGQVAPEEMRLPRLEQGLQLEVICQYLARRAEIETWPGVAGPLRGYLETAGPDVVIGWAQDLAAPEQAVSLDVYVGGQAVCRVLANLFREDLRAAGVGLGRHGFTLQLPVGVAGVVSVCRSNDQVVLPWAGVALAGVA